MSDKEKLPAAIELHISNKCDDLTAKFRDVNEYDAGYILGYDRGYSHAATEAAHLLHEVFQKHESGLLPDRFIYNKIKMFLYGK